MGRIFIVFLKRLWLPLLVLAGFLGVCVIFYVRVEGLRPLDALFWVIHPHSIEYRAVHKSTKIFSMFVYAGVFALQIWIAEMTDDLLAYSVAKMKEYGIVDSGDTYTLGIGAMKEERVKDFFDKMVKTGLVKADTDWKKSYTSKFINKGVGVDLRPK